MVKLTKIYTRTGDGGTTSLANRDKVAKFHPRVEAYGAVDEANATLGLARAALGEGERDVTLNADLTRIQNDMFDVGADLATPGPDEALGYTPLRMVQGPIDWLEGRIDAMNASLEPLKSFILPAGSEVSARLHVARTTTRRAERRVMVLLADEDDNANPLAGVYLNRLSDYLFVAARWVNQVSGEGQGSQTGDELWVPGENR